MILTVSNWKKHIWAGTFRSFGLEEIYWNTSDGKPIRKHHPQWLPTKMAWYSDNPRPKNGSFMTSLGMKPRSIVAYLARSAHSTLTILWFLSNVGTCRMDRWIQMDCWSKVAGDHWVWLLTVLFYLRTFVSTGGLVSTFWREAKCCHSEKPTQVQRLPSSSKTCAAQRES